MKKKKLYLVLFLIITILISLIEPQTTLASSSSDFVVKNGVLIRYIGPMGAVIIPKNVTAIADGVFETKDITSVKIPNTVKSIGINAFTCCTKLKEIEIPSSVQEIRTRAFYSCNNLNKIIIKNKNVNLGEEVFGHTKWLKKHSEKYVVLNENLLLYNGKDTTLTIPNNIRVICGGSLNKVTKLKSIKIPNSVKIIGEHVFDQMFYLDSVEIANSVTEIREYAFNQCYSLANIELPSKLKIIGNAAFYDSGLNSITLPKTVDKVDDAAFAGCKSLEEVNIPKEVSGISDAAFWESAFVKESTDEFFIINHMLLKYNGTKKKVTIPDGVTKIMAMAFYDTDITEVTMPDSVKVIGDNSFNLCSSLKSIKFSSSVVSIKDYAFHECTKLTKVTLPKSLVSLGDGAFYDSGLRSITLPKGLKTIKSFALSCKNIKKVSIPASVTSLNGDAFNSGKIKKLVLQNGSKKLPCMADIYSFVIPNSVTKIDPYYGYSYGGNNKLYTFYCKKNSYAYKFAIKYKIKYKLI